MTQEPTKTNKRQLLLNLINHAATPEQEREAARLTLARLKKADGRMTLEGIIRKLGDSKR